MRATDLDGVYRADGHACDGHAAEDVPGDLEEAHDEGAVEHVAVRLADAYAGEHATGVATDDGVGARMARGASCERACARLEQMLANAEGQG